MQSLAASVISLTLLHRTPLEPQPTKVRGCHEGVSIAQLASCVSDAIELRCQPVGVHLQETRRRHYNHVQMRRP